ncbi:MAG: polysaccharide deacetylase family protein [Actinomycetia bacterium]|nr:polysaccharide deacetylase family protein [Actinomycetes bacterium]
MTPWVVGIALAIVLAYWVLPDLLGHFGQIGAVWGDTRAYRFALTFDDGPGPDTAAVLDRLEALGVRATFFLVAERALEHPEVVRRMVALGHEIGLHGMTHRSAWTMAPWTAVADLLRGRRALERLTGRRIRYVRPPWGHHNLVTWVLPRLLGLRRVLWTVAPDDWRPDRTPEAIARHVVRFAQPGGIAVLHDAGGDRSRTVAALDPLVAGLKALAFDLVPVGELGEERSLLRRLWFWWEGVFTRLGAIDTVPATDGGPPVMRLGRAVYRGPRVEPAPGVVVRPGDPMAEIHFQNPTLGADSVRRTGAVRSYARVARGLADVARWIEADPAYRDVAVVGGVTVLDAAQAIERLGFFRVPVGGLRMFGMRIYLVLLMAVFHAEGWRVLGRFFRLRPVLIFLPRDKFVARFGRPAPDRARSRRGD